LDGEAAQFESQPLPPGFDEGLAFPVKDISAKVFPTVFADEWP